MLARWASLRRGCVDRMLELAEVLYAVLTSAYSAYNNLRMAQCEYDI